MGNRTKRDGGAAIRLMSALLDEIDEERAKRLRESYGLKRWVLSWTAEETTWLARISGPGRGETIERTGRTRVEAIERAASALKEVLREE